MRKPAVLFTFYLTRNVFEFECAACFVYHYEAAAKWGIQVLFYVRRRFHMICHSSSEAEIISVVHFDIHFTLYHISWRIYVCNFWIWIELTTKKKTCTPLAQSAVSRNVVKWNGYCQIDKLKLNNENNDAVVRCYGNYILNPLIDFSMLFFLSLHEWRFYFWRWFVLCFVKMEHISNASLGTNDFILESVHPFDLHAVILLWWHFQLHRINAKTISIG